MKKLIYLIVAALCLTTYVFAGKEITLPSALNLNSDKGELVSARFEWGATPTESICVVTYRIQTNDRQQTYRTVSFTIGGSDFTDLVLGFGATMESRLETAAWQDIQDKFELVP